jgi:general secretion pathway protein E
MRLLGELLLDRQLIRPQDLDQALAFQREHGERLGAILVRLGAVSEDALYQVLAAQSGQALVVAGELSVDAVQAGLALWPYSLDWWQRHGAIPWVDAEGILCVAAPDLFNAELRESLEGTQRPAWRYVQLRQLESVFRDQHETSAGGLSTPSDLQSLREMAEDAPVITFVNNVMAQAVEARASDVHFEPGEREFEVRLRIDGVLHPRMTQPMTNYAAVTSRVKLIAGLDIAERRLPQDGRTSLRVAGAQIDVRVSAIPAVHGESLVLRLLPKERSDLRLDRLGMGEDHLALFRRWLNWPNGLVLVTGPTGSGKSTTLYGALAAVNDRTRKIVTVEDPVEYRLPHVVQIQTQAEIGYTFSRALRSILRHDPDVIMIGEIRDRETAEIAVQSALTGHLVLATLHTNDALSAVTRLVDMGVEPYLVAAALRATMAQRLVRRLCEHCAQPDPQAGLDLQAHWDALSQRLPALTASILPNWRRASGCPHCQGTGFRGRLGLYELVGVAEAMQHGIAQALPIGELMAQADAAGRRSLVEDGLIQTAQGHTRFDEVLRAAAGAAGD